MWCRIRMLVCGLGGLVESVVVWCRIRMLVYGLGAELRSLVCELGQAEVVTT